MMTGFLNMLDHRNPFSPFSTLTKLFSRSHEIFSLTLGTIQLIINHFSEQELTFDEVKRTISKFTFLLT